MSLVGVGAVLGIVVTVLGAVGTLWATRIQARSKKHDSEIGNVQLGQTVLMDGIKWSEQHNRELRIDLLAAEGKIEVLEGSLRDSRKETAAVRAEMQERDDVCRDRLRVLATEIQKLKGTNE